MRSPVRRAGLFVVLLAAGCAAVSGCAAQGTSPLAAPAADPAALPVGCTFSSLDVEWGVALPWAARTLSAVRVVDIDARQIGARALASFPAGYSTVFEVEPSVSSADTGFASSAAWARFLADRAPFPASRVRYPIHSSFAIDRVTFPVQATGRYVVTLTQTADLVGFRLLDCRGGELANGVLVLPDPSGAERAEVYRCGATEYSRLQPVLVEAIIGACVGVVGTAGTSGTSDSSLGGALVTEFAEP